MIKGALIFLITINLIGCNMKTKISDVSQNHSNQNISNSYIGNYLTANYSIIKGDAYTASRILDKNLSSLKLLEIKFFSNLVSGNFDAADEVSNKLKVNNTKQSIFYNKICNLLNIRRKQKAFHPNAQRLNLKFGSKIYGFKRISKDKKQSVICITNLSSKPQKAKINKNSEKIKNLLNSRVNIENKKFLVLKPFETVWLSTI